MAERLRIGGGKMTKQQVEEKITNSGYRLGTSWEDENLIYACSIESLGANTYGHPKCEAMFYKDAKFLRVIGGQAK